MRQVLTNANRLALALAALGHQAGYGRTLIACTLSPKREYRRLFLVLAGVVVTYVLLLFVQFPTSASQGAAVKRREARKNRSDSSLSVAPDTSTAPSTSSEPDGAMSRRLREAFGKVPLGFEANRGQTDAEVKFLCRGSGYTLFLTSSGAVFALQRPAQSSERQLQSTKPPAPATDILGMLIVDANPRSKIEGLNQLPGHSNYFIGGNAAKWFANIPNYSKVQYREIYRGIDLVYYGNQRQLENDFIIAPAADPRTINLSFAGAKSISIDQDGALLLKTAGGQVQMRKPVAYQDVDGSRHEVAVKYELRDPASSVVGFDIGAYDRSRPLIIDPVFIYSTFLGGLSSDVGSDIALDSSGNAYLAGYTGSANFPTLNSVQGFQPTRSAFVTKINATGTALVYSTYLGGSNSGARQFASGIALDATGNAYVTGLTISSDFPTTANAFQQTKPTGATADAGFVTKLNPSGTMVYSTYLGGPQGTQPFAIATDGAGNAYVAGTTGIGFPLTAGPFSSSPATTGFLTKLNTNASGASALVYSTFLGTTGTTFPRGITVDAAGNAYVTGTALSNATGFASAGAFQTTYGGGFSDVFVAKFNTNASGASSRVYSTYVGGSGDDSGSTSQASGSRAIAIDAAGNAYITGRTTSTNFPVANAFQANKAGTSTNAFLTKLNSTGSGLVYSTYFGGNTTVGDEGSSVAVNVVGNAYLTGLSDSSNFPVSNPITPIQSTGRIFLAKFTPEGNALVYSTRLGTNQGEFGLGVALDGAGNAFITGTAFSSLPTTAGAFQTTNAGIGDAFISQVADPTIIGRVVDEDNNPIPSATVNLTGVPSATTTTDANGYFTFGLLTVANNYTVTVSVPTYIFTSQAVNNLQKNVRLNFNPVVVSISGRVTASGTSTGVTGVTMSLTGGKILSAPTNGSGNYSFGNLPAGRSYTVTPSKTGLTFVPTSTTFDSISTNQTANFLAPPIFEPVVLTAAQVEIKTWTFDGRTYAYLKLSFPNAGYRVVTFGQATRAGNDFTGDASVEKFSGPSVQAVTTTAGIYDLGILSPGSYNFIFKNSGTVVKTQAFTVAAPPLPANPIDNAREFVRQQYRDFLNREADPAGEAFWTDNITKCSDPARRPAGQTEAQCTLRQRETTSGAFFQSPEFQYTGYFVYRMYQGALGRQPKLSEFTPDAQLVGAGILVNSQLSGVKIEENKAAFAAQFVNCTDAAKSRCAEFKAVYDGLNNQQYVDRLFQTTGVNASAADRAALVNELVANPVTGRASVLQKVVDGIVVISEGNQQFTTTYGQAFYNSELNRAFVLLQYFGYMKRDPDDAGYAFWLGKLNQFGGNFVNAEMVLAFISSPEYRSRFGPAQSPTENQPPAVNAGPDESITLSVNTVNLSGTATDDGRPVGGTLTVSWTRVSGPGTVTFSNASAAVTTATFSTTGTYVLRLTANDTQLVSSDDVTVTVNAVPASLTAEQRVATTRAVSAKFQSLSNSNPDRDAVNQELLNFIRSRPEFVGSAITPDSCVWATYTDGVGLVVINHNDLPDASTGSTTVSDSTGSSISEPQPQLENLPNSDQASLFFALGSGWPNPTGEIRSWLNERGYKAVLGAPTVAGLKTVGGDGVFYHFGHGGNIGDDVENVVTNGPYVVTTAEQINPESDKKLENDLKPRFGDNYVGLRRRLVHAVAIHNVSLFGSNETAETYAITDQFIRDYWGKFSTNSFVFISACSSASPFAAEFMKAIEEKGASVYAGWSKTVTGPTIAETTKFVFDRLLGANKVYPEKDGFKQRPFDYKSVEKDLKEPSHELAADPYTGAQLVFKPFTSGFQLLAPSIARMYVDEEAGELILNGIFGDKTGTVVVDKVNICGEKEWNNDEIRCNLPEKGAGSSGDVFVLVDTHKSNVAQLTEWEGDFVLSMNTDVGPHQQQGTIHARFRADAREWRPVIHNPPVITPDMGFTATMDSYLDYSCSGSSTYTSPGPPAFTETVIWSGAGRSPRFTDGIALSGNFIYPVGQFVNSLRIDLLLSYNVTRGVCKEITIDNNGSSQRDMGLESFQNYLYPQDQLATKISLGNDYAILPGSESRGVNRFEVRVAGPLYSGGIVRLKWNRIEAKHPPNSESPR